MRSACKGFLTKVKYYITQQLDQYFYVGIITFFKISSNQVCIGQGISAVTQLS